MTSLESKSMVVSPRDRWIPWYFVLFFVVLALVDGVFVTIALRTHSGVVTEHAYQKGLAYNHVIDAAEQQQALGWSGDIYLEQSSAQSQLFFVLKNQDDTPLEHAVVHAKMVRVTQQGYDVEYVLNELQPGSYSTTIQFPLPGLWEIRIVATWKNQSFQMHKRLMIK